jgi:c-di-GMP-binding flagellar brake protein YcgR
MADAPDKAQQRKTPRITVTPKSDIFYEDKLYRALVQDLSDGGMLLLCTREFAPGTIIGVHLNLAPGVAVDCEVEVRHCSDAGIGVKIDYMDDANRKAYQAYLQEFFAHDKLG